jgi:chaperonin GroEL
MQRGIAQIAGAVRPTLGPLPRRVAIESAMSRARTPELLDDGGTIARRIIQLPDRDEDMGAMYLRSLLWRLRDEVGDGTATAAVLFQAVFDGGLRYIAAGGNPMLLRGHLERGARAILDALPGLTHQVSGQERLARLAAAFCADPPLAETLGEIFDIIGDWGQLEIRTGHGRALEREYVEGMYWDGGLLSRLTTTAGPEATLYFPEAAILIGDLAIEDEAQLVPVLELARGQGFQSLVVVASRLSDPALALLLLNQDEENFRTVAVRTPGLGADEGREALEDLALLTGGRPLFAAAGDSLRGVAAAHLGRARRAWANRAYFGIVGGQGSPRALRDHLAGLRAAAPQVTDTDTRDRLRRRIGRLLGGSATLWVGAATERTLEARKELAERTAEVLRGAIREGVVPGGGAALLACRPAIADRLARADDPDERAACGILLEAPGAGSTSAPAGSWTWSRPASWIRPRWCGRRCMARSPARRSP